MVRRHLPRFAWAPALYAALLLGACPAPTHSPPVEDGGADPIPDADAGVDGGTSCLPLHGEGTALLSGLKGPGRLAANGTHLYVTVRGTPNQPQGRLVRVGLNGGLMEEVAQGLTSPDAVAATDQAVFVADADGLWRVDLPGLGRTLIDATANNAAFGDTHLLVDDDAVIYATAWRWLKRVQTDGSGALTLYTAPAGDSVRALARHGTDLYFLVAGTGAPGLYKVPLDGSAQATLVTGALAEGTSLAADGDALLWASGSEVGRVGLDGQGLEVLQTGLNRPARVVRVEDAVYFKDLTAEPSPAFFQALGPCGKEEVGPTGVGPGGVLWSGEVLYFSSQDVAGSGFVGRLP